MYFPAKGAVVFSGLNRASMPKNVLIADDSGNMRSVIRILLNQRTDLVVCGEAGDGRQAVEKARALKPDLILLDLAMPEMNGAETASVLRRLMPDVPIILFTMYRENMAQYLTSATGVDAVLSKPDGMTTTLTASNNRNTSRRHAGGSLRGRLSGSGCRWRQHATEIGQISVWRELARLEMRIGVGSGMMPAPTPSVFTTVCNLSRTRNARTRDLAIRLGFPCAAILQNRGWNLR
jgi:DNA-binding NarL/FixJ family response regulator